MSARERDNQARTWRHHTVSMYGLPGRRDRVALNAADLAQRKGNHVRAGSTYDVRIQRRDDTTYTSGTVLADKSGPIRREFCEASYHFWHRRFHAGTNHPERPPTALTGLTSGFMSFAFGDTYGDLATAHAV